MIAARNALLPGRSRGQQATTPWTKSIHIYPTYGFALQQSAADMLVREFTSGLQGMLLRLLAREWRWAWQPTTAGR